MPNNTRIPYCPYYKDEKNKSISCEDTYHVFSTVGEKYVWMDMYCDEWDWTKCPYAMDLTEAYARFEKGDEKALEKQKIEAMQKELKSLSSKLGRAEKRIERQQKKMDELRAVNQSYMRVNAQLEKTNKESYHKWRDANTAMEIYEEKIADQVQRITDAYEVRLAYMIDKYGTFSDIDVDEWRQGKSFALVYDEDDDGYPCWNVVYEIKEIEDGESDNVQTDVQEGQEVRQQESTD